MGRARYWVSVALAVLFTAGPFLWQVVTSLRPEGELVRLGPRENAVLGTAGSFSAISALFGGPLPAGVLLVEAGLAMGAALVPILLPGLVAAACGYLIFIGLGDWAGIEATKLHVPNLPDYANVEVEAVTDSRGLRPIYTGPAPVALMGLLQKRIAWQELVADAAVKGDRGLALEAMMVDEMAIVPEKAEAMLDELLASSSALLPQFARPSPV